MCLNLYGIMIHFKWICYAFRGCNVMMSTICKMSMYARAAEDMRISESWVMIVPSVAGLWLGIGPNWWWLGFFLFVQIYSLVANQLDFEGELPGENWFLKVNHQTRTGGSRLSCQARTDFLLLFGLSDENWLFDRLPGENWFRKGDRILGENWCSKVG